MRKLLLPFGIIAAIVLADQLTKFWAVDALTGNPPVQVIGDWFMLSLVYNEGGAMGTRFGTPLYYLGAACLILTFLLWYIWRHRHDSSHTLPLAFIAGGAIGNIIDRARIGKVVDFLDVDIPDISFAGFHLERFWTFNIADAAITCAIVWFVWLTLFGSRRHEDSAPESHQSPVDADPSQGPVQLRPDSEDLRQVEEH